ncbi:hemin uptake protein HemP [Luteimonas kalidii]|uniref:Hemin uptake protein HemP n=1 Tax=Luteimonas kalidii TaxID=3042025 RepID=A0ABT6JVC6_9GAMM|nr:hemin uptake protein HemP [Luteimonas kalidii]MDH5834641.1 hemin uptake protein HemP [Luteimonas kalidii]
MSPATQTFPSPTSDSTLSGPAHPHTPSLEIDSLGLLQGQRELRIRHGNETYRLRHTRNDKLILTK